MRYVFLAIIVFLIGLGLFFYGALGFKLWETFHLGKLGKASIANVSVTPQPTVMLRGNNRPFFGLITKVDGNVLHVKNRDGKSVAVLVADSTTYVGGKRADLKVKTEISGVGKVDEKGMINPKEIKIDPQALNSSHFE